MHETRTTTDRTREARAPARPGARPVPTPDRDARAPFLVARARVGNARAVRLTTGVTVQRGFEGRVSLPRGDQQPLILASAGEAAKAGRENPRAMRVDLQKSLKDQTDDPGKDLDMDRLILAHACRIGEGGEDVILNCKSGKTRTPVVAIVHLLLREPGLSVHAAVTQVAAAFRRDREGIGIDYNRNLTGVRLLDEDGRTATAKELQESRRLKEIHQLVQAQHHDHGAPHSPAEWRAMRTRFTEQNVGKRNTPLWTNFHKNVEAEDRRLADLGDPEPDDPQPQDDVREEMEAEAAVPAPQQDDRDDASEDEIEIDVQPPAQVPVVAQQPVAIPAGRRLPARAKRKPPRPRTFGPVGGVGKPKRRNRPRAIPPTRAAVIRRWARGRGYRVKQVGRLPQRVIDAYDAVH